MRAAAALLALGLSTGAGWANCPPPYSTLFACDIPERDARVELCELLGDDNRDAEARFSYNYTVGNGPAELFFTADGYYFSTKYMDPDGPEANQTVGFGLARGTFVYGVFITGEYLGQPTSAQIQVFDKIDDFSSDDREVDLERRYCEPSSIRVNWDNIAP